MAASPPRLRSSAASARRVRGLIVGGAPDPTDLQAPVQRVPGSSPVTQQRRGQPEDPVQSRCGRSRPLFGGPLQRVLRQIVGGLGITTKQ